MITIINFSHPIPDDDTSIARLIDEPDGYRIIDIPVQLELNQTLVTQIETIFNTVIVKVHLNIESINFIRLPGYAAAAVLILSEFQARDHLPQIIRFAGVKDATPPRFEAIEIIRLRPNREVTR